MGFKISWIAFLGLTKTQALEKAGLTDTGQRTEAFDAPFCCAELPDGWVLLFANDFEYASPDTLERVSTACQIIGCQLHEGVMYATTAGYSNGRRVWAVTHDSEGGMFDLTVEGEPPQTFPEIQARQMQKQRDEGGDESIVDYIFDIPIETAMSICGYRHDQWRFNWGVPEFTRAWVQ
jgi:hypothetical protein